MRCKVAMILFLGMICGFILGMICGFALGILLSTVVTYIERGEKDETK